jgi:hypothetical protein
MELYENSIGIYCIMYVLCRGEAFVCKHNGDMLTPGLQELNYSEIFVVYKTTSDINRRHSRHNVFCGFLLFPSE